MVSFAFCHFSSKTAMISNAVLPKLPNGHIQISPWDAGKIGERCFLSAAFKITSNKFSRNVRDGRNSTLSDVGQKGLQTEFPLAYRLSRVVSSRAARLNGIIILLQWNPDFSNPRYFEPPDFLNHGTFPLDLLQSNTVILPPIFRTLDFSKLPIFRTNSYLPWKKFITNLPSVSRTRTQFLSYYSVAFI